MYHILGLLSMQVQANISGIIIFLVLSLIHVQQNIFLDVTRKYPLCGYILGSGETGTPGVIPKTYGTTFISDIL